MVFRDRQVDDRNMKATGMDRETVKKETIVLWFSSIGNHQNG